MSILLSSPVSHRHLPDPDLPDAKNFKLSVLEYVKGGIPLHRAPSDPEFVPYAQERDYIGNLITRRSTRGSPSPVMGASNLRLRTKPSSIVSIDGMSPSVMGSSELSFNTFKFQPKTMNSMAKIPLKKVLKPLDINKLTKKGSSPCFRTSGRDSSRPGQAKFKDFPSVGHYEVRDILVHKAPQQVSFNRDIRIRKPRSIQRCASQDIDVAGAYNKVYLRKSSVLEFSKHTDRASHYYTNVESGLVIVKEPKQVLNLERYEEPLPKKNPLEFILKDNLVEVAPRWKRGFELDPKNMPFDLSKMQNKFVEMKKKYQVYKAKLS